MMDETNKTLPISPINLKKEKIYLFFSKDEDISYSFYTDGDIEHIDTWIDKRPYDRDLFLKNCEPPIKRFEFYVTNANIVLLEKNFHGKRAQNLYVNQDFIYKVINNQMNKVSISDREKIMIKRKGEYNHEN